MNTQFCSFHLDRYLFGVEVERVQEVVRHQPMTRVPLAPAVVGGLINLRGQIVTAIDLRCLLGLPARPDGEAPMNVVLRSEDGAVSLLVDEIDDVIDIDDEAFETAPETVKGPARDLILGVYKLDGRLLLSLNVDTMLGARRWQQNN
jgi:purine-binding chemotaxis protein CheW